MTSAQATRPTYRPALYGAVVACVGVIVGSFGTWIRVMMLDVDGLDLDWWGIAALILGIVSAVILLALLFWEHSPSGHKPFDQKWVVSLAWVVTVAGVASFTDALTMIIRVLTIPDDVMFGMSFSVGWGLWLLAVAGIVLAILGAMVATSVARGIVVVGADARAQGSRARRGQWVAIIVSVVVLVTGVLYAFATPFSGGDIAEDLVSDVSGS